MSRSRPRFLLGFRAAGRRKPPSRWRRLADLALALALLGAVALAAAFLPGLRPAQTLEGAARVADGDTLVLAGERIRLQGIDAPELAQPCARGGEGNDYPCGRAARDALLRLVAGRTVACESRMRDRYDRILARCLAGPVELNRAMVEAGWAVAYGDYRDAEEAARLAGRGIWAGPFERPQDWRRSHGGMAEDSHDAILSLAGWLKRLFGR